MPQFLITAIDYKDADALSRRMAVREQHLERMRAEKDKGVFVVGGAQINHSGNMYGSVLIVNLPDAAAVHEWAQQDPYITGKVWEDIQVTPFRVADV